MNRKLFVVELAALIMLCSFGIASSLGVISLKSLDTPAASNPALLTPLLPCPTAPATSVPAPFGHTRMYVWAHLVENDTSGDGTQIWRLYVDGRNLAWGRPLEQLKPLPEPEPAEEPVEESIPKPGKAAEADPEPAPEKQHEPEETKPPAEPEPDPQQPNPVVPDDPPGEDNDEADSEEGNEDQEGEEPEDSLAGQTVRFTRPSVMYASPGGGTALRYPYNGYVTQALADNGTYVKIAFGSRSGWVDREHVTPTNRQPDYIRLGWQWVSRSDSTWVQSPPNQSGYNVYSPVMFYVRNIRNMMDSGNHPDDYQWLVYVAQNYSQNIDLARERGYQVWLTFQKFGYDPDEPAYQQRIVDEIITWARFYDADGINIDFENMGSAGRDGFTNLVKMLYQETQKYNITLSVDVVRPASGSSYSASYNRPALARHSDYLVLMAYDEHWASSPHPGSVASLPWTESSITSTLNEGVPADKLMLGIPFYSRNWRTMVPEEDLVLITASNLRMREGPGTSYPTWGYANTWETYKWLATVEGTNIEGNTDWHRISVYDPDKDEYIALYVSSYYSRLLPAGERYVSSYAVTLQAFLDIQANYDPDTNTSRFRLRSGQWRDMSDVVIGYDSQAKQIYVTYTDPFGFACEMWLEDFESLKLRRQLMEKYNLPGLAAWSLEWLDLGQQGWNQLAQ